MAPSKTVIVGWDMVSPLGTEMADQWERAAAGASGIGPLTRFALPEGFPVAIAGQVPDWDASLRLTYNKVDNTLENSGSDISDDEKTLLFNIRYSESRGQPFMLMGRETDAAGFGELTGVVFFDENGDGRRQAGERAATGVFVYLDRRYQAVTDRDGRYVFTPVPAGMHDVTLAQEDLPLPWGLLDEAPRPVQVEVRGSAVLDFALQRLDE